MRAGSELSGGLGAGPSSRGIDNELSEQNCALQLILLIAGEVGKSNITETIVKILPVIGQTAGKRVNPENDPKRA